MCVRWAQTQCQAQQSTRGTWFLSCLQGLSNYWESTQVSETEEQRLQMHYPSNPADDQMRKFFHDLFFKCQNLWCKMQMSRKFSLPTLLHPRASLPLKVPTPTPATELTRAATLIQGSRFSWGVLHSTHPDSKMKKYAFCMSVLKSINI